MWKMLVNIVVEVFKRFNRGKRIEDLITDVNIRLLRLEIIEAMRRKDTHLVCVLFDDYKKLGGNHYLDSLYENYMEKHKKTIK